MPTCPFDSDGNLIVDIDDGNEMTDQQLATAYPEHQAMHSNDARAPTDADGDTLSQNTVVSISDMSEDDPHSRAPIQAAPIQAAN